HPKALAYAAQTPDWIPYEILEADDVNARRAALFQDQRVMLIDGPRERVVGEAERYGPLLGVRVRRPGIPDDVQQHGARTIGENLFPIDGDDGTVANEDLFAARSSAVLPRVEGCFEEGGNVAGACPSGSRHARDVETPALVV